MVGQNFEEILQHLKHNGRKLAECDEWLVEWEKLARVINNGCEAAEESKGQPRRWVVSCNFLSQGSLESFGIVQYVDFHAM